MGLLEETIGQIGALDAAAMDAARTRQATLTKPPGSLGRLEDLAIWLAGITGQPIPQPLTRRVVYVLAADHGVTAQGVSAYPAAVTGQMVRNFAAGGAAINALAQAARAEIVVADLGVASDLTALPERIPAVNAVASPTALRRHPIAQGTADMTQGPAMSRDHARAAIETGIRLVLQEAQQDLDVICTGEMGIGNTTSAAAITAGITGISPEAATGPGTGLDAAKVLHKATMVRQALEHNRPNGADGLEVLAAVGGFEIGGLVGLILGAAARRIPVVLDGYIAGAAALIAATLCPASRSFLVAGHRSAEPGHTAALAYLGLTPLLDLELRLGEGTGAVLALSLLDAALAAHTSMATFASAGVSGPEQI